MKRLLFNSGEGWFWGGGGLRLLKIRRIGCHGCHYEKVIVLICLSFGCCLFVVHCLFICCLFICCSFVCFYFLITGVKLTIVLYVIIFIVSVE